MGSHFPLKVEIDSTMLLPKLPMYPLIPQATKNLRPIILGLLKKERTLLFSIRKSLMRKYQLIQYLQPINRMVKSRFPWIPNPNTILTSIFPDTAYFTFVDLCSAFFSILLHLDSQNHFVFSWENQQYTWVIRPQGCTGAPTYFFLAIKYKFKESGFPL